MPRKKKIPPYTSGSLVVSRRMITPGPLFEERAIIYDLRSRYRSLKGSLREYAHGTGQAIADEVERLHKETWRRIEALPEGPLRTNLSRSMYDWSR